MSVITYGFGYAGGSPVVMGLGGSSPDSIPIGTSVSLSTSWTFSTTTQRASSSGLFTSVPENQTIAYEDQIYYYSNATQELANYFPWESIGRLNWISNLQQFVNPIALFMEDFRSDVNSDIYSFFPDFIDCEQVDILSIADIPYSFTVEKKVLSDGTCLYKPPLIYAIAGPEKRKILISENNSVSSCNRIVPSGFDFVESVDLNSSSFLSPLTISPLPKQDVSLILSTPSNIYISFYGFNRFSSLSEYTNKMLPMDIILTGITDREIEETEKNRVFFNGTIKTSKKFISITKVEFTNTTEINIDNALITLSQFPYTNLDDEFPYVFDGFYRKSSNDNFPEVTDPVWWKVDTGVDLHSSGGSVKTNLVLGKLSTKNRDLLLEGLFEITPSKVWALFDLDDDFIVTYGFAVGRNYIYVIGHPLTDSTDMYLYLFTKRTGMPDISTIELLDEATYDPRTVISFEDTTDYPHLNTDGQRNINLTVISQGVLIANIERMRLSVINPLGIREYININNGEVVPAEAAYFNWPAEKNSNVNPPVCQYTMTEYGDYVFVLETQYKDTMQLEEFRGLVQNAVKKPLAKYKLALWEDRYDVRLNRYVVADGSDGIIIGDSSLSSGYKFVPRKDLAVIDYYDRKLYLTGEYTSVEIYYK